MDSMNSGGPLNAAQTQALESMRIEFRGKEDPEDTSFPLDDSCLLRYLVARNFDVKKAALMLQNTLKWRQDFGVKHIHTNAFMNVVAKENSTGKIYLRGYDEAGHIIMYMRPKFENTNDHDGNLKHLVYNLERAIACMKQRHAESKSSEMPQEKLALLVDYDGYSLFNAPPMRTSNATLDILQNHYPERLWKAYCIRPPWIFSGFWKMISPFIDVKTKTKIVMVGGGYSLSDICAELTRDSAGSLTASALEKDLGGEVGFLTQPNAAIDCKNGKGEPMDGQSTFSCARYLGLCESGCAGAAADDDGGGNDASINQRAREAFPFDYNFLQGDEWQR